MNWMASDEIGFTQTMRFALAFGENMFGDCTCEKRVVSMGLTGFGARPMRVLLRLRCQIRFGYNRVNQHARCSKRCHTNSG